MNRTSTALFAAVAVACVALPVGVAGASGASGAVASAPGALSASAEGTSQGLETEEPGTDEASAQVTRDLAQASASQRAPAVGVDIQVAVHIFYDRDNGAGKLTAQQVFDELRWLNHSYSAGQGGATTRFDFVLKSYQNVPLESRQVNLDRTVTGDGSSYTSARTKRLMRENHDGTVKTLNIWVADLPGTTTGRAMFPQYAKGNPQLDGIWVDRGAWRSTPTEGSDSRNQGDTVVHEIGHWIGALEHADTTGACVSNFMSYAADSCRTSFTRGQADRLSAAWTRYRE